MCKPLRRTTLVALADILHKGLQPLRFHLRRCLPPSLGLGKLGEALAFNAQPPFLRARLLLIDHFLRLLWCLLLTVGAHQLPVQLTTAPPSPCVLAPRGVLHKDGTPVALGLPGLDDGGPARQVRSTGRVRGLIVALCCLQGLSQLRSLSGWLRTLPGGANPSGCHCSTLLVGHEPRDNLLPEAGTIILFITIASNAQTASPSSPPSSSHAAMILWIHGARIPVRSCPRVTVVKVASCAA
mmetsp:Transcript_21231/g.59006  ORF Transcript_21231/g.59006 Transcript_21231/m.59006 type:complete len:240 (-) Transcript_21231:723-1442(-)